MLMPNPLSIVTTRAEINDSAQSHLPATTLCDSPSNTSNRRAQPCLPLLGPTLQTLQQQKHRSCLPLSNPLAMVPAFLAMTHNDSPEVRARIAVRACLFNSALMP